MYFQRENSKIEKRKEEWKEERKNQKRKEGKIIKERKI